MMPVPHSEPSHSEPSHIERLRLFQTLNRLPENQFEALVFALEVPVDVRPSALAPRGNRSSEVLTWVESPTGPNLPKLQAILDDILGLSRESAKDQCPYKGLSYFDFNDEDYKYFYGRESLTETLFDKVENSNFTAIVGASGSGKSSVLRAGLLQQLKQGDRSEICILTPGDNPLQNLALAFVDKSKSRAERALQQQQIETSLNQGADGLRRLVQNSDAKRVILVVDQFEEAFTLCQKPPARQQFFETLLGALEKVNRKLCVVLAMRSDFVGRCFEQSYGGLADQVQNNLEAVLPMERPELTKAITGPAASVGLEIESELVQQLLDDVESSPGNLPLLQYTLQELWKQRQGNTLELKTYVKLGGVTGTLQKRANEIYNALDTEQQQTARHIFLNLTQPGESTEDTRRRIPQSSLETAQHAESTVAAVVKKLADAKLIVTNEEISGADASRVPVVDVAHEALIRHWDKLRTWLDDNREALVKQRSIENAAEDWTKRGKPRDYLLQGAKLSEAEHYLKDYVTTLGLSNQAEDLIKKSRRRRKNIQFASLSLIAGISALGVFTQQQFSERQFQVQYTSVLVGGETSPDLLHILPKALQIANRQVDSGNTDAAVESYKALLTAANRFVEAVNIDGSGFEEGDHHTINEAIKIAEHLLANLVDQIYLPVLQAELDNQVFGSLKTDVEVTDFEEQYKAGALKTTYRVLMRNPGLKADVNDNGFLDSVEKHLIPCETLIEIERLWRRITDNRCGFYGKNGDYYRAADCWELEGNSLTERVFPRPLEVAIDRLDTCGIKEIINEVEEGSS